MREYALTIAGFVAACGLLTFLLGSYWLYAEGLGLLSLLLEAGLGVPQFLTNLRRKSTEGMRLSLNGKHIAVIDLRFGCSVLMVCSFLSGDIFKTVFFVLRDAPLQV